jgi:hypothetical protein
MWIPIFYGVCRFREDLDGVRSFLCVNGKPFELYSFFHPGDFKSLNYLNRLYRLIHRIIVVFHSGDIMKTDCTT